MVADTARGILSVPELEVYEKISRHYTLDSARDRALQLLEESALSLGAKEDELELSDRGSVFNMVRGFFTSGQNIRIKAQVKPGLIQELRSDRVV